MIAINLRDYYPSNYTTDSFIEVPDEVADVLITSKQSEAAYQRRKYYNHAQYSLDRDDGLEQHILRKEPSAEEVYECEAAERCFYSAFASLSEKQARRVLAHYFMGISNTAIAKAEGVSEKVVRMSIRRGLDNFLESLEAPLEKGSK